MFPLACSDHDECGTGDDKCHVRSTCINTQGSYMCQCKEGWTGDGRHCSAEISLHNIIGIACAAVSALLLVIVVVMIISRQNANSACSEWGTSKLHLLGVRLLHEKLQCNVNFPQCVR